MKLKNYPVNDARRNNSNAKHILISKAIYNIFNGNEAQRKQKAAKN